MDQVKDILEKLMADLDKMRPKPAATQPQKATTEQPDWDQSLPFLSRDSMGYQAVMDHGDVWDHLEPRD